MKMEDKFEFFVKLIAGYFGTEAERDIFFIRDVVRQAHKDGADEMREKCAVLVRNCSGEYDNNAIEIVKSFRELR